MLALGEAPDFGKGTDGILRFRGRICVPSDEGLKKTILEEAHKSSMSIHPGSTKMYQDLKKIFWWPRMKRDVAEYVAACLVCQKVKIESDDIQVRDNLTYDSPPVRIADRRIKSLRGKEIPLVKVVWSGTGDEDATWELEDKMREIHPQLFA